MRTAFPLDPPAPQHVYRQECPSEQLTYGVASCRGWRVAMVSWMGCEWWRLLWNVGQGQRTIRGVAEARPPSHPQHTALAYRPTRRAAYFRTGSKAVLGRLIIQGSQVRTLAASRVALFRRMTRML